MKRTVSNTVKSGLILFLTDVVIQFILCAIVSVLILTKLLPQDAGQMLSSVCVPIAAFLATSAVIKTQNTKTWQPLAVGQGMYLLMQIIVLSTAQCSETGEILTQTLFMVLASFAALLLCGRKKHVTGGRKYEKLLSKSIR